MGATAAITIKATASGLPEGGIDQIDFTMTNTSAANTVQLFNVATAVAGIGLVTVPSSGRFLMILPPSTNTFSYRMVLSATETGVKMSSRGMLVIPAPGSESYGFYTTEGTTFSVRAITY